MGLPEPARLAANVSMAVASVRVAASLTLRHDEGQVDDAVAVEGAGAQHVGVVQVTAQHLGAHVGDCLGGGVRAG